MFANIDYLTISVLVFIYSVFVCGVCGVCGWECLNRDFWILI